ncbi:fumarylacetoacetate hydrolase family protein [Nocardia australiensis]|uniref:fumarylacetoacetate hydrolase family protein n=1 Tax=Nocardia australiensis TaxID=2887191 RepID=UPI001D13E004|nr:fumarylacetoacetate hydrolase family protein [Nocardia australiensis]
MDGAFLAYDGVFFLFPTPLEVIVRLARQRLSTPDGPVARVVVSGPGSSTWFDVRSSVRRRAVGGGATAEAAARIAAAVAPASMSAALAGGEAFQDAARQAISDAAEETLVEDPVLTNALDPVSYRDFMVFEEHFSFGYRWQNRPVPEVMYELPVSYAGDPLSFLGPDDEIPWPGYTRRLDYELELGIVIGRTGSGLTPETALNHVLGFTILNDVSARDIQAHEMTGGLGPSKGKHFACVAGPIITTLDEIPTTGLQMTTRVNGETWCAASSAEMVWSVSEIVAWASQGEVLRPGALLGTGTCNGGSTVELDRSLTPGDVIELEIERLGILRNTLGTPARDSWRPPTRPRRADGRADRLHFLR